MRIAVVGLGAIAQKAYLPVVAARDDVELVLCTRNRERLRQLSSAYRVAESATSVGELLAMGVEAALVHTATESHVAVAAELLRAGVHVYVDKPIAYGYEESRTLVELAERAGRILMVGFNRRFAPMYRRLQANGGARVVIVQKNRTFLPDYARRFVFDDFIHVVDTMRFFAPGEIGEVRVSALHRDGRLHHVLLQLDGPGVTAVGLMNRDSGIGEETLEVMTPGNKWVVRGLNTTVHYAGGEERTTRFEDWEPVLSRRGFPQMIDHFLECVRQDRAPSPCARDALETHALCERIVMELERNGAAVWTPGPS
jgi:virulence factor